MESVRRAPTVFISSTCRDLQHIRENLKDLFEKIYGFHTTLSEFDSFPIDTCKEPLENCLSNVDTVADLFVLLIGTRYGYVTENGKSITHLEYLHAKAKGIPIYVFINKQVNNTLLAWQKNKDGDFSYIVDNTKLFEFVEDLRDTSGQWVHTFESGKDIEAVLKYQLSYLFQEGLSYKRTIIRMDSSILDADIPSNARRVVIEKPYAWELKFFAYVIKYEFEKLQKRRWDFKYGIFTGHTCSRNPAELLDDITEKNNELLKLTSLLDVLINKVISEALGKPGEPSDLELMVYVAKQLADIYERMIAWSLYFKTLSVDDIFDHLLELMYELTASPLKKVDEFVDRLYTELTNLPPVYDGVSRNISISCVLDEANTSEIIAEIERLRVLLCSASPF